MKKIAILHTGGTFVMVPNETGRLRPGNTAMEYIERTVIPGYRDVSVDQFQLFNIDSSLFTPSHWVSLSEKIKDIYEAYDGFIIIHGTDTLSYSAAALSFMLENLRKPVVFTGSQLPFIEKRSDAFSNLNASIEVVLHGGLHEVAVVFNNKVYRGNRVKKRDVWDFHAFYSPNYGLLIRMGIDLIKQEDLFLPESRTPFSIDTRICSDIISIPFFPGLDFSLYLSAITSGRVKGIVIQAYGSGNIPSDNRGLDKLFATASDKEIPMVLCSQSPAGRVNPELYDAAKQAEYYGLIGADDMTVEASVVKLMIALGRFGSLEEIKDFMKRNVSGEKR